MFVTRNIFRRCCNICDYIVRYLGGEDASLNMKFIMFYKSLIHLKVVSAILVVSHPIGSHVEFARHTTAQEVFRV